MMLHEDWNLVVFVFRSRYFSQRYEWKYNETRIEKHIQEIFLYELKMGAIDMQ